MEKHSSKSYFIESIKVTSFVLFVGFLLLWIYGLFIPIDFYNQEKFPSLIPFGSYFDYFDASTIIYIINHDKEVDSNIVLVNLGQLTRKEIASLVDTINLFKPKVIAIDVFFMKPKDKEGDSLLENALSKVNNLVLASKIEYDSNYSVIAHTKSSSIFSKYGYSGIAIVLADTTDKKVQGFIPYRNINGERILSFSAKIAQLFKPDAYTEFLKRNNKIEPIVYTGNYQKFLVLNATALSLSNYSIVKDKIVLIGILDIDNCGNINSNEDIFKTPISRIDKQDMFGMVVQANIISMILNNKYIDQPHVIISILLFFIILYINIFLLCYLCLRLKKWYYVIIIPYIILVKLLYIFTTTAILLFSNYLFKLDSIILFIWLSIPSVVVYFKIKDRIENRAQKVFAKMGKLLKTSN